MFMEFCDFINLGIQLHMLKGSYDVISSFHLSLEYYKLFVHIYNP